MTERSDLSDNLVSLFMVGNLFTIDYDSGWQYLWISNVTVFWLEFHMLRCLAVTAAKRVFVLLFGHLGSNDTFHVNCAC